MFPLGATPGRLGDNFFREKALKAVPLASNRRNDATNDVFSQLFFFVCFFVVSS